MYAIFVCLLLAHISCAFYVAAGRQKNSFLQILWAQSCSLRNARKHFRADLLGIMKCKNEIGEAGTLQCLMGTTRSNHLPTETLQCGKHLFSLCARPLAHAAAKEIEIGSISCSPFSMRSATTRSASASAKAIASSRVSPYFITPGSSFTSAIQRPSSSCSVSTVNCTSVSSRYKWRTTRYAYHNTLDQYGRQFTDTRNSVAVRRGLRRGGLRGLSLARHGRTRDRFRSFSRFRAWRRRRRRVFRAIRSPSARS